MTASIKIALASDHAGVMLKRNILDHLAMLGYPVVDLGVEGPEGRVDYPDRVVELAAGLQSQRWDRGIAVCGSGIGVGMALNRLEGVRAVTAWNEESARLSRQHNESNALCLGERLLSWDLVQKILTSWLQTDFEGGRHQQRIEKLDQMRAMVASCGDGERG